MVAHSELRSKFIQDLVSCFPSSVITSGGSGLQARGSIIISAEKFSSAPLKQKCSPFLHESLPLWTYIYTYMYIYIHIYIYITSIPSSHLCAIYICWLYLPCISRLAPFFKSEVTVLTCGIYKCFSMSCPYGCIKRALTYKVGALQVITLLQHLGAGMPEVSYRLKT